jgi:TrmH family RNA methyltransferase
MITSLTNSRVKQIRKLRDRKFRKQTGLFYAEGIRIVAEALQLKVRIDSLIIAPRLLTSDYACDLVEDIKETTNDIEMIEVDEAVFRKISYKENPQGIAAVIYQQWYGLEQITRDDYLWVALDEVQDPGNLGSILRTNDAVGGSGVILLDLTADPYDPSSIRGSMGAIFNQKLIRSTLNEFNAWKMENYWHVIGTSGSASTDYQNVIYPENLILLMGSERLGLQLTHKRLCDQIVKIPMVGRSDSLNLASATAVVLYEIFNQHRRRQRV